MSIDFGFVFQSDTGQQSCRSQGGRRPRPRKILADQLTLFKKGRVADYGHHITTCPPGFSDLPTALGWVLHNQCNTWFTTNPS